MKPVKLFYHGPNKGRVNFGDALSPIIVREVTGRDAVYSSIVSCELLAIGSILDTFYRWQLLRHLLLRSEPVTVWGSGFIRKGGPRDAAPLRAVAVRGPHSRDRLGLPATTPLGDPGLLVRDLTQRASTPSFAWGIVPHMADIEDPRINALVENTKAATIIRLDDDPMKTLSKIGQCERIVSTSLHGVIAADALGIPNWWLEIGDRLKGGHWKFEDYFASINRTDTKPIAFPEGADLDKSKATFATEHFAGIPALCDNLRAALTI